MQVGSSVPKTVVDRADKVAREFGMLFEQVEQYCISKFGQAVDNRNPRGYQYPALRDIGVRNNPLNYHRVDDVSVRHDIISEAPFQQAAEAMMADYTGRVFLITRLLAKHIRREVLHKRCFSPINNRMTQDIDSAAFGDNEDILPAIKHGRLRNIGQTLRQLRGYNLAGNPCTLEDLHHQPKFIHDSPPKGITNQRADLFWRIAVALFPGKRTNDWRDLLDLIKNAHMLVLDMYTIPNTAADYIITWTKNGDPFNPDTMAVRGSIYDRYQDNTMLRADDLGGATVSFAITPMVEQKVYRANGTLNTKLIFKAQVTVRG